MLIGLHEVYKTFPLKDRVSYKEFDRMIKTTFKKVRDEIIDGEKIKTPLGIFAIIECRRSFHRPSVDIVNSMKERKRLILEGIIPYENIKNENGEIIGNNGGVKYFVYFTDDTFFMFSLGVKRKIKVEGIRYKFMPSASTERLRRKKFKEDDLIYLKYAES